jgi:hypothetical protein
MPLYMTINITLLKSIYLYSLQNIDFSGIHVIMYHNHHMPLINQSDFNVIS